MVVSEFLTVYYTDSQAL